MTLPLNNPEWKTYLPFRVEQTVVELVAGSDGGPHWTTPLRIRIFMSLCELVGYFVILLPAFVAQTVAALLGSLDLTYWSLGYLGAYAMYAATANILRYSELNIFQPLGFQILKRFLAVKS